MWIETAASEKLCLRSTTLDEYIYHAAIFIVYKYGV